MNTKKQNRTWCKYWDCSLEKLEFELETLDKIWTNLEKDWETPKDIEDVYRIYPLLDTTAALARKMIVLYWNKNKTYKVEVINPTNDKDFDTKDYLYSDEHKFFNGNKKEELLANVVSTFLHGSGYVYMDTRKNSDDNDFKIYVFVKTDRLCKNCAESNLEKVDTNKPNYRKTIWFVQYDDCICGEYINVRSYINAISKLVNDRIK